MTSLRNGLALLTFLAAPAFAASVQSSHLLPVGAYPSQVRIDAVGNVYVGGNYSTAAGASGFLAKISADGTRLLAFSQGPAYPAVLGQFPFGTPYYTFELFVVEPNGSVYASTHYHQPGLDGFHYDQSTIYKVDPEGAAWQPIATYDGLHDMTVDADGNVYLAGYDRNVISTAGSLSLTTNLESFISKLNPLFGLIYSIHGYGGSHIAADALGKSVRSGR
jgi:hypothetical protein